jgi:hypothetical protein
LRPRSPIRVPAERSGTANSDTKFRRDMVGGVGKTLTIQSRLRRITPVVGFCGWRLPCQFLARGFGREVWKNSQALAVSETGFGKRFSWPVSF